MRIRIWNPVAQSNTNPDPRKTGYRKTKAEDDAEEPGKEEPGTSQWRNSSSYERGL
jgi:hypothetical protein